MGETRGCRPPERPTYPGLVRPYRDENDYVNQPKFIVNKMSKTVIPECLEHDPFSIYDDDSAHDHYFFLPAGKLDLSNFKKTSSLRETTRSNCGTWSRTKPDHQRLNLKNTNSQTPTHCQCKSQTRNIRHTHNCRRNTNLNDSKRSLITNKTKRPASGEYCSLAVDAVAPKYPGLMRSSDTPIDEESFRKFALKLVRSNSNCSSDINQNSNDYHNPSRTKKDSSNIQCFDDDISKTKSFKMNTCIDRCTCMVCIKAGRYHWSGDTDSFAEEPCSCIGTRKNIVGRWICMGVVALFLPCLVCYLPAKLCQNSCSSTRCTKTKLKNKQSLVKYVNEQNDRIDDNTLL